MSGFKAMLQRKHAKRCEHEYPIPDYLIWLRSICSRTRLQSNSEQSPFILLAPQRLRTRAFQPSYHAIPHSSALPSPPFELPQRSVLRIPSELSSTQTTTTSKGNSTSYILTYLDSYATMPDNSHTQHSDEQFLSTYTVGIFSPLNKSMALPTDRMVGNIDTLTNATGTR